MNAQNPDSARETSFYSEEELGRLGLAAFGKNVLISRKASIYGAGKISIGSNVRIDDFCILSGRIELGNHIHVAAYSALYGGEAGVFVGDFANISSRVCVYSVSDDYSGNAMTNPTVPGEYKDVDSRPVHIESNVIIGSTSVVLPGVHLAQGSAFGSFSLIKRDSEPWSINAGIPAKKIKDRSRKLLDLEAEYEKTEGD